MKVAELKRALSEIQAIYEAGAAKKTAEDFGELVDLLDGAEDQELAAFLGDLRRVYVPKSKPRLVADNTNFDATVVDRWLKRIEALPRGGSGDDALARDLKADKSLGKPEANALQHRFIGGRAAHPSRKAAIDAIAKSLAHRRREDIVHERIKDSTRR